LQAFIDRESGNRPGKRVVFDHSDYDDLLGKIQNQILSNKQEKIQEVIEKSAHEAKLIEEWR